MKKILLVTGIVIALFGLLVLTQRGSSSDAQSNQFSQIQKQLAAGAELLDVRTPEEYKAGHISGATHLSLQDLETGALPTVAKNKQLYVYCHTGNRSAQATAILEKAGYTVNDLGAISNVVLMGGTIVK